MKIIKSIWNPGGGAAFDIWYIKKSLADLFVIRMSHDSYYIRKGGVRGMHIAGPIPTEEAALILLQLLS